MVACYVLIDVTPYDDDCRDELEYASPRTHRRRRARRRARHRRRRRTLVDPNARDRAGAAGDRGRRALQPPNDLVRHVEDAKKRSPRAVCGRAARPQPDVAPLLGRARAATRRSPTARRRMDVLGAGTPRRPHRLLDVAAACVVRLAPAASSTSMLAAVLAPSEVLSLAGDSRPPSRCFHSRWLRYHNSGSRRTGAEASVTGSTVLPRRQLRRHRLPSMPCSLAIRAENLLLWRPSSPSRFGRLPLTRRPPRRPRRVACLVAGMVRK